MAIKLYDLCSADKNSRFSPACWRTRMALAHKGLEVETVPTLFSEIRSIEGGGQTTVPVIADGDTVMRESFDIAVFLERAYPELPSLFRGEGGIRTSQFMHWWTNATVDSQIARFCILDIYNGLDEKDKSYFRQSRETRFKRPLEQVQDRSEEAVVRFRESLLPLRLTISKQDFIGGDVPIYADYCIFGSFQWGRMVSDFAFLETDDPVAKWFERCLDLFDGLGRNAKV
ncbi:glutathione S-transferase family protein [Cohaesibacter celericrescens]|uniref:Beta-aryl ether-cleaving protein n=1 Tax=Cohaesibacter celericrescens TaxID=2067669 RepID=A0A2N5XSA7_9HYPH|nr:glutathione S-transferase family protein [Cohaesibacter celericrescens]PLW77406.1 beta-aryl ether-cleaving protein [Cohaesibacter celericrescens]